MRNKFERYKTCFSGNLNLNKKKRRLMSSIGKWLGINKQLYKEKAKQQDVFKFIFL